MKVTLVCQGFDRSTLLLQPWRRVYEMSKRIASKGISVTILTDGSAPPEEIEKIKVIRTGSLVPLPFLTKNKLLRSILDTDPDAVVWYGTPFSATYLSQLKSLGKPLIWDIDTDIYTLVFLSQMPLQKIFHPTDNLLHYIATAVFSKFIVKTIGNSFFVSKIIVPNMHLKNVLCKRGIPPVKIAVVPSTTDRNVAEEKNQANSNPKELRAKLGLNHDDFIVTYFGAPNIFRGPDVAISSMKKILRHREDVRLLIFSRRVIGSLDPQQEYNRKQEEYLRELMGKLGVNNNVEIIPGFTEKSKLREYLRASNAIVLPFRIVSSEPPLSVFEAMSLGKTVITTDIGGLREIVGKDRGVLVESGNAESLADAILFLAKNPDTLAFLGENAKRFAKTLPDWNEVAQQFADVLDDVSKQSQLQ